MSASKLRMTMALAYFVCASSSLAQQPQTVTVPLSRPGDPIFLDISIQSARIEVIGEDRQDAVFEVTVSDGNRKIVTPSGTQSLKGGGYSLEIDEDDNEISFDTDWNANKMTVLARVPRNASVELETVNDGEIIVSNLIGDLELSNTNGPITAKGISGSVIAESINDTIDISFTNIDADNASSMESINGDVFVGLPENVGVRMFLDTAQGEIYSDFEVEIEPSESIVERDEDEDGVRIRIENVIVAEINGGGPVIRMKSLHGDINIRMNQ